MLSYPIQLDREVELLIIVPFRLGFDIPPTKASDRENLFPKWAKTLNQKIPDYEWNSVEYNDNAPTAIQDRKSVFLKGLSKNTSLLKSWVLENSKEENWLEVRSVEEEVLYYDWGLGALDLRLLLKITDEKDIRGLSDWAEKIFDSMDFMTYGDNQKKKEEGIFRTQLFEDWDRNSKILLDLFSGGSKTRNLDDKGKSFQCGWTEIYHFALIVKTTNEGGMSINGLQQLKDMMESFAGRAVNVDEVLTPFLPGILACAEGLDGTIAILDADCKTKDYNDISEQVKWLNWFAILFYANLNNYIDRLADKMLECQNYEAKNIRENLKRFRNERLQLQLFLNESSPRTVAVDDATTEKIYNGVWESRMGNKTAEEINYQLNYLQSYYADSISLESSWLQTKMNHILLVINVMIFATVIATLIGTYDIKNTAINPVLRLLLIATGAGLFGVLSLLTIFRGWVYRKSER